MTVVSLENIFGDAKADRLLSVGTENKDASLRM